MKANHTYIRFDDPDLTPKELDPNWDKETLLFKRGVFPLVSVAVILGKEILVFRKAAKRLNEVGGFRMGMDRCRKIKGRMVGENGPVFPCGPHRGKNEQEMSVRDGSVFLFPKR